MSFTLRISDDDSFHSFLSLEPLHYFINFGLKNEEQVASFSSETNAT